jgi:hypothetical protein
VLRAESIKFRDYHNDQAKRKNRPVNERWRGWKNAMTNWFSKPMFQNGHTAEPITVKVPRYMQPFEEVR